MSWIELVAQRRPPTVPPGMQPPDNAADWFRIENNADSTDSTDIYVYDAIGGWYGLYTDSFIRDLKAVSTKNINLRINSPGGSVFDGVTIANALRSHPANVTVYVDGLAASIASIIALSGDRLVMMPQTSFMIHDASGSCYGNAADMEGMRDLLDKQSNNLAGAYAAAAGGTVQEWRDLMKAETWYTAEEAVAAGLADEVMPLPQKAAPEEETPVHDRMTASWNLTAYRYAGRDHAPEPVMNLAASQTLPAVEETPAAPEQAIATKADLDKITGGFGDIDEFYATVRSLVREELTTLFDSVAPSHSTSVEDGTWDAGAQEKRLPSPVPLATVKKIYTYWDEEQVEDGAVPKTACKLPHHFVSDDGTPGAASVNGVRNALARLPQTKGLTDAERSAAEAHLRKHLAAFDSDEEDVTPADPVGETQADETPPAPGPEAVEVSDAEAVAPEEIPPDTPQNTTENNNEADAWETIVGLLVSPTSPSADDVFAQLKEGW